MSFSSVNIEGKKAAPDRIYYNGTVVNNSLSSIQTNPDPNVVFQDQRQTPLVPDSSNYEVAVQNFSLNGCPKTLPLFIPQISPANITNVITSTTVANVFPLVDPTEPTGNQTVTFTCSSPVTLSAGNVVKEIRYSNGIPTYFLNFDNVTVISATPTTFTIAASYLFVGTVVLLGSAVYTNPADINTTIYSVSFGVQANGAYRLFTRYVVWEPENIAPYITIPTTAQPLQSDSQYYYSYSYTHWVSLVNKALLAAWTATVADFPGSFGTQCPFIEYDETTGLFSINQDSQTCMAPFGDALPQPYNSVASVTTSASGNTYQAGEYSFVGMNTCLENLLTNFNSFYFGAGNLWKDAALIGTNLELPENVINMGLSTELLAGITTATTPVGVSLRTQPRSSLFQLVNPFTGAAIPYAYYVRLPQDFISTGGCWSPIASFVIITTQIPVRNEASANPINFGDKNIGGENGSGGAFQKVLIETPINALKADIWKGFIFYEPVVETYSSLDPSHDGITNVDAQLFWRNRLTNSLVPVRVPNQGSMSFRLLFRRKLIL
jgi:hypothetical protein